MYLLKKINIVCLLLVSLISANNTVYALTLGDLKVYSYLNEPLSAEIILDGVDNLSINNIMAELASDKDFERTGIPKSFLLNRLKFEVLRNNNITVVHVSTNKPIKETYVDFLLQVVWPDGKIIKNYTILLDPAGVEAVKRETPVSKQKTTKETISKNNFSSAIFATSLEDTMENEISLEQKKQIAKMAEEVIASAPPVTQEVDLYEAKVTKDDYNTTNIDSNGILDKVASSLQVFAQQPHRTNVDYEKLLDLKPSASQLSKHEIPIAENLAMSQINNELKELRRRDEQNVTIANNVIPPNANHANKEDYVANQYLERMKKYGNDLLLAFFLVSTTMFLFYKIVPISNKNHEEKNNTKTINADNTIKDNISIGLSQDTLQVALNKMVTENSTPTTTQNFSSPFSAFSKNEELELKLDLAKQYIEAGDKHSAKDILQDLNNISIKEPKYRDQLDSLLRCIV